MLTRSGRIVKIHQFMDVLKRKRSSLAGICGCGRGFTRRVRVFIGFLAITDGGNSERAGLGQRFSDSFYGKALVCRQFFVQM